MIIEYPCESLYNKVKKKGGLLIHINIEVIKK